MTVFEIICFNILTFFVLIYIFLRNCTAFSYGISAYILIHLLYIVYAFINT